MTTEVNDPGPLDWRVSIVDKQGRPSPEFQRRWNTSRNNQALIGTITFGSGAPPATPTPADGAEYADTSTTPYTTYIGQGGTWHLATPEAANPTGVAKDTAVNGTATTFMRSDAAPAVQKATTSQFGLVKPDGATVDVSAGVISVPTATTSSKGLVQPDGSTITISGSGVISSAGGGGSSNLLANTSLYLPSDFSLSSASWDTVNTWAVTTDPLGAYTAGNTYVTVPTGATWVRVSMQNAWSNAGSAGRYAGVFGDNLFTTSSQVFVGDVRPMQNESLSNPVGVPIACTAGSKLYPGYNTGGSTGVSLSGASGSNFGRPTRVVFEWYSGYPSALTPGGGTVTSVNAAVPGEFSVSGGPIVSSGTLTIAKTNQNANQVWAGPSSGSPAQPGFRTLVAADIPALPYGVGTVTSVGLTAPTIFSVGGSPVTTSGNLSIGLATQTANTVWAGPSSGGAASPTFRTLTTTDIPSLSSIYLPVASNAVSASKWVTARTFTYTGDATGSSSVDGSANVSTALTLATVNSNVGSYGSGTQVPVITVNAKGLVTAVSTANITAGVSSFNTRTGSVTLTSTDVTTALGYTPGTGNGTVISVGMSVPGALLSVTGSAITGSGTLAVSLVTQSANQVFAGPSSGSAATPTFRSLVAADIPTTLGATSFSGLVSPNAGVNIPNTQAYQIGTSNFLSYGGGSLTSNLAIGVSALAANTTGIDNVAIGASSLLACTTGSSNIGIGAGAGDAIVGGGNNVAIGVISLSGTTSGSNNTAIGNSSGTTITTGGQNITIGAGCSVPTASGSGQINIGGLFFGTGATATGTGAGGKAGILTNSPRVELDVSGVIATKVYTVAGLPSASGLGGARAVVSDATSATFTAIVAGGGGNTVPVYCDGTNWRIG